jgi:hypothetical protein
MFGVASRAMMSIPSFLRNVYLFIICLWLYSSLLGLGRFFSFLIFLHSRWDSLDGVSARRKAATDTQNKRTQTSIPQVGFEPMIPEMEQGKTVYSLDCVGTAIGSGINTRVEN